jgi:hemin uptake protein HemP
MEFSLNIEKATIRQGQDVEALPLQLKHLEEKRMLTVEELFAGTREVLIRHQSEIYRLKITRQGKLILNK